MFFFGPLFMILLLAAIVAAAVLLVKWLGGTTAAGPAQLPPANQALNILKERFARGEIDQTEFEERRRVLGE
jgi:putative membrane protein